MKISFHPSDLTPNSFRNCPKYINVRELGPHPDTKPFVAYNKTWLLPSERLPDELIAFVHAADTVFIGTSYKALKEDEAQFPSHVGQNQRAGKPGYMRVMPSDGRTVVLPDYSGMSSSIPFIPFSWC